MIRLSKTLNLINLLLKIEKKTKKTKNKTKRIKNKIMSSSLDFIPVLNEDCGNDCLDFNNERYFTQGLKRQNGVSDDDENEKDSEQVKQEMYHRLCTLNSSSIRNLEKKIKTYNLIKDSMIVELIERVDELVSENKALKVRILRVEREVL